MQWLQMEKQKIVASFKQMSSPSKDPHNLFLELNEVVEWSID